MRKPSNDNVRSISADDAAIAAALEEASIPALVNTLVHLTGDLSLLNCPRNVDNGFFGDAQGGISIADQTRFKALALKALKDYRDKGCPSLAVPNRDAIQAMMNFMIGETLPNDYIEFLESELALNGEDSYAQPALLSRPSELSPIFSFSLSHELEELLCQKHKYNHLRGQYRSLQVREPEPGARRR